MSKDKKSLTSDDHKEAMRQQALDRERGKSKNEIITLVISVIIALYLGFYGGISYQRHKDAPAVQAAKTRH